METVKVTRSVARRFLIRQFALEGWQPLDTVAEAIARLEFVQEDSICVCGRIHDLILLPRVRGYTPALLHETLYGTGATAFERHFPNLAALPLTDYPHFVRRMQERAATPGRWAGLYDEEKPVAEKLLARIQAGGAVRTRTIGAEDGHTTSGWGTRSTLVAHVAEKLWLHGILSIARRENFERWFDLTERVYPGVVGCAVPDAEETTRHLTRKTAKARRLWTKSGVPGSVRVEIAGVPRRYYCLKEDTEALVNAPSVPDTLHLLAPLDPLIYDRRRNEDLWDFDYRWEVYTPEARRVRGYYALPILYGEEIVGWVEPRIDRKTRTLTVLGQQWHPGVDGKHLQPLLDERLEQLRLGAV